LYDQKGVLGHVAEHPELADSKSILRRCRLAKLLDTRFSHDRGIHLRYLLDLIEDRGTVMTLTFLSGSTASFE
jgi:hypothetical protein